MRQKMSREKNALCETHVGWEVDAMGSVTKQDLTGCNEKECD